MFGAFTGSCIVLLAALILPMFHPRPWRWWEEGPPLPRLSGYVVDDADILPQQPEQKLIKQLRAIKTRTGHRFMIVTVPTLAEQSIEGFGLRLGRSWAADGADIDDSVMLIVAPNEYGVRIQVGSRLDGQLSNPVCREIIRRQILPSFAAGDFAAGVEAGTKAIARRIG